MGQGVTGRQHGRSGLSRGVPGHQPHESRRPGGGDFAWSERLRSGRPGDLNAWETFKAALPAIVRRLRAVELAEGDAVEAIARHDQPGTLISCDPPYVPSTRTHRRAYRFEMTTGDHTRLLTIVNALRHAAVMLSGYRCDLLRFRPALAGWRRTEWDMPNHAGQGRAKQRRTECLWQRP